MKPTDNKQVKDNRLDKQIFKGDLGILRLNHLSFYDNFYAIDSLPGRKHPGALDDFISVNDFNACNALHDLHRQDLFSPLLAWSFECFRQCRHSCLGYYGRAWDDYRHVGGFCRSI